MSSEPGPVPSRVPSSAPSTAPSTAPNPAIVRLTIDTPEQMGEFGALVAEHLESGDLLALNGELGAGKTTFTRGLGRGLGVRGTVTSPTFVLARTHPREDGVPLVHVDAYRLSSAVELDDLDIDFEESIVVVEWAQGMLEGVNDSWLEFRIDRPHGAAETVAAETAGAETDGAETAAAETARAETARAETARAETDGAELDEEVEPRRVTVTGHGPRWVTLDWLETSPWRT